MQSPVVLSFRKRLSNRGYTCISIVRDLDPFGRWDGSTYKVYANEPLANMRVICCYDICQMSASFR